MKKTLILLLLVSFCGGTDLSELEKDIVQTEERIEDLESKDALTLEEEQELENLREQFEELEGTKAEELEGTEAVEEIVVLETQKKEENSGISEEDFDEYIAGLEDYGAGGSFVPIPLKLDDFKPLTESGNCLSDDVTVIEPREYIYLLI